MTTPVTTLDPEQYAAATTASKRVRVIAGAGSGKTRTLIARIAYLLRCGVPSEQICVITFTRKAADELLARVTEAYGELVAKRMFIGTIHALGLRILMRERPGRRICDEAMRIKFLRRVMAADKRPSASKPKFGDVLRQVRLWKAGLAGLKPEVSDYGHAYQRILFEEKLWDLDDLISEPLVLLEKYEEARARWQGRWTHLLVDEVQDTDKRQWGLLYWLVSEETCMYLVGDLGQSIYHFRGARPEMLLNEVEEWFGPFTDFSVRTNYRSRPTVLQIANGVMKEQPGSVQLQPHRTEHPFVVQVLPRAGTPASEGRAVIAAIQEANSVGYGYGQMAVLVRTNGQMEPIEAACYAAGVPVVVVGGMSFYNRREIMDVMAYLRLAVADDPAIEEEALERVYNRPSRFLGAAWKAEVEAAGGWEALFHERPRIRFSKPYMGGRTNDLLRDIGLLRELHGRGASPHDLVAFVLDRIGYRKWIVGEEADDAVDEMIGENLDALLQATEQWTSTAEFLNYTEMCRQRVSKGGNLPRLQLSTVHRAKGLEWPVVAVVGLTEGVLPHRLGNKAEERRIFYVAVTRAMDRLILSGHGSPSPYWEEALDALGMSVAGGSENRQSQRAGNDLGDVLANGGGGPVGAGPGNSGAVDGRRPHGGAADDDVAGVHEQLGTDPGLANAAAR